MNKTIRLVLWWSPRILSISLVIFFSLFTFDIFTEYHDFREKVLAFLIHLIPSFILLIALILAWKWEWIGALVFIGAGVLYILITPQRMDWIILISGPLLIVGVLYLVGWIGRKKIRGLD